MTKLRSSFLVLLFSSFYMTYSFSQVVSKQFSQVDRALINLYDSAINNNYDLSKQALKEAQNQWIIDSQVFVSEHTCTPVDDLGFCKVDGLFDIENMVLEANNFEMLAKYSLDIIRELQALRSMKYDEAYPLTDLWQVYIQYQDMHETVHDQMFGLREWFEFEDVVGNIAEKLESYDEHKIDYINDFFPHINAKIHMEKRDKVSECFLNFLYSLESGYRPDFEWPCDELGAAIYDMILLYR